jgi:hypothetical protein
MRHWPFVGFRTTPKPPICPHSHSEDLLLAEVMERGRPEDVVTQQQFIRDYGRPSCVVFKHLVPIGMKAVVKKDIHVSEFFQCRAQQLFAVARD